MHLLIVTGKAKQKLTDNIMIRKERAMNANTHTESKELLRDHVEAGTETSKAALGAGMGVAGLIGLWAVACLIGGLASAGLITLIMGYVKAVTGM